MIWGREQEQAQIREVIAAARSGQAGVLLLAGEPGIGKTTLLHAAAGSAGMRVLRTTGVAADSNISFVGLVDLLTPVLAHRDGLAPPQRAALERALAARQSSHPTADNRLALRLATLALLAAAAEESPTLVIVDDAQSVDRESLDAVAFAARRLAADRIAFLFAVRLPVGSRDVETHVPSLAGFPVRYLEGLDPQASDAVLTEAAPNLTNPVVRAAVLTTAAGNPLALREIPRLLQPGKEMETVLAGPLPVGEAVRRSIGQALGELTARTRRALVVAAASTDPGWADVPAALAHLELDMDDLGPAEAATLIQLGAEPGFRHPLVRASVYHAACPADRRAAHRALAAAAIGDRAIESRAIHLAAAATGPDPAVAATLAAASRSARDRGAWPAAMTGFARAAQFATDPELRLSCLLSAAEAALLVDAAKAAEYANQAIAETSDPLMLAHAHRILAACWNNVGEAQRAAQLLIASAERVDARDPELGVLLRLDATVAALHCGDNDLAERIADEAAVRSAPLGSDLLLAARTASSWTRFCRAEADPDEPLGAPLTEIAARIPDGPGVLPFAVIALPWLDQYDLARDVLDRIRFDHNAGLAPDLMLFARVAEVDLAFRTGRWAAGIAAAEETARLADDLGHRNLRARALTQLALFEAAMGRADDCVRHVREANSIAQSSSLTPIESFSSLALGLLAISTRDYESAAAHLEFVRVNVEKSDLRHPGIVPWAADLIEALHRIGARAAAEELFVEHDERVRRTRCRSAEIGLARCRIILGLDRDGDEFASMVDRLGYRSPVPVPFEQARLLLTYGERLRLAGRRSDSRRPLRHAKILFDQLHATPWAQRSAAELRAAGGRVTPAEESVVDRLSAQELQVAREVARGARNREVAAALFLSEKTVERHLSNVYRKLGIRSRAELVTRMTDVDATPNALPTIEPDYRGTRSSGTAPPRASRTRR